MTKNFNIIPPPDEMAQRHEVHRMASTDLIKFGQLFIPTDFMNKEKSPWFHYEIGAQLIDTQPGARLCNIVPRGFAKSTLMKTAILLKILYGEKGYPDFIAWCSETSGTALDHVGYIKDNLEFNPKIHYYFGDISRGKRWTEKDFETKKGDRIIAIGTEQRIRGKAQKDNFRYTGFVLDDFESELNTKTPERRRYLKELVASAVFPSLEETVGREGWIWLSGTIVHYDSYLQTIIDGYRESEKEKDSTFPWTVNFYQATDDGTLEGKPIWEERFPTKKLKKKQLEFLHQGTPYKFWQEYFNIARDPEMMSFNVELINDFHGEFKSIGKQAYVITKEEAVPINVYMGVDPAATATNRSDYQAIIVLGIDYHQNRYILDMFRERIPAFDFPPKILQYAAEYEPIRFCAIETVASQEMLRDMTERMSRAERRLVPGLNKGVKPPPRIKKEDRLEQGLSRIVNGGKLYMNKQIHSALISEMMQFPKSKHDDLMDALYYADFFAKPPRSQSFPKGDLEDHAKRIETRPRKVYNWMTGLPE